MTKQFNIGDRVLTPGGKGRVVYRRMAPPDYSEVAAYSVFLDNVNEQLLRPTSIYPADQISEETGD